jgi:hypothetical protein
MVGGLMLWMIFGCVTSHHILSLSDVHVVEQKSKNAEELVQIIGRSDSTRHLVFAAESAGKLRTPHKELEEKLLALLSNRSSRPVVRIQAAWALGEIGRTSDRVYPGLLSSLSTESNTKVIQHILEAIAKVYLRQSHTVEEDLKLVRALDGLHSRTGLLSGFFTFLHKSVESMEVLSILLLEALEKDLHIHKPNEYYPILLNFLWFCSEHQSSLMHRFSDNKETFSIVFSEILRDPQKQSRKSIFLSLWFLVQLSNEPKMADITGSALLNMDNAEGSFSDILAIHLSDFLTNTKVRDYFRDIGLNHIDNEALLTFLSEHHNRRDIVQYLYGISGDQ